MTGATSQTFITLLWEDMSAVNHLCNLKKAMNCRFSCSWISQQLSFLTTTDFFAVPPPLYKGGCWQWNPFLQARKNMSPKDRDGKVFLLWNILFFPENHGKRIWWKRIFPVLMYKKTRKIFWKSEIKIEDIYD